MRNLKNNLRKKYKHNKLHKMITIKSIYKHNYLKNFIHA